jgi:hypothetical protein
MRMGGLLLALVAAPAWGPLLERPAVAQAAEKPAASLPVQTAQATRAASPTVPAAKPVAISRQTFSELEKSFDRRLTNDGMDLMGLTRGLYISSCGAVFTTEVSLARVPGPSPFRNVDESFKLGVHKAKVENLGKLKTAMKDMITASAKYFDAIPANEQIVLAIRFWYESWEDTSGLPAHQILMRADRKSALAGAIQTEEQ